MSENNFDKITNEVKEYYVAYTEKHQETMVIYLHTLQQNHFQISNFNFRDKALEGELDFFNDIPKEYKYLSIQAFIYFLYEYADRNFDRIHIKKTKDIMSIEIKALTQVIDIIESYELRIKSSIKREYENDLSITIRTINAIIKEMQDVINRKVTNKEDIKAFLLDINKKFNLNKASKIKPLLTAIQKVTITKK